jgi:hypothetical protein
MLVGLGYGDVSLWSPCFIQLRTLFSRTLLFFRITFYPGIWACLTYRTSTSVLACPLILITLKEATSSPSFLGKVGGLAASVGAASRTIAPALGGQLYAVGVPVGFTGLAWWVSGFVMLIGVIQVFFIDTQKSKTATVRAYVAPNGQ